MFHAALLFRCLVIRDNHVSYVDELGLFLHRSTAAVASCRYIRSKRKFSKLLLVDTDGVIL